MILILPHRAVFNTPALRARWQAIHLKETALLANWFLPAVYLLGLKLDLNVPLELLLNIPKAPFTWEQEDNRPLQLLACQFTESFSLPDPRRLNILGPFSLTRIWKWCFGKFCNHLPSCLIFQVQCRIVWFQQWSDSMCPGRLFVRKTTAAQPLISGSP